MKRTLLLVPPHIPVPESFPEYVDSLPAWEVDLLRHTELFVDPRMTCFSLQPQFFAGCDGSSKFGTHGAFGWTISTHLEERAATGMGPSRGEAMDSYRAECSGMLSFLRFLIRLAEFTAMFEPWCGVLGTDSQSLIDRLFQKNPCRPAPTSEFWLYSTRSSPSGTCSSRFKLHYEPYQACRWCILKDIKTPSARSTNFR